MMPLEELQNGRYRRLRLLGTGGMGEVYLMDDMRVSRQVAIKVIRAEGAPYPGSDSGKDAARLFQREARAIAALEHPNILPLYDFGEETHEGTTMTYMVMPFSPEGSLADRLRQPNAPRLSLQDIAHLVEQAAEALQYAHEHQMIHLDVKSSNFLLRSTKRIPMRPTLLLADFGIARSSVTVASSSRTIRGTPTSMAPEQWSSVPVPATDQYALAVMTYELLAGRSPFLGGMEQLMYQHFNAQPSPPSTFNPQLPAIIDAMILRALAKKPEDRFPSIAAFASAFEQAARLSPTVLVTGPQQSDADEIQAILAISQTEAHSGTSRAITLPGGQQVSVAIPAGVSNGQVIRLPAVGDASNPRPELILTIAIKRPEEAHLSADISAGPTLLSSQPSAGQAFERGSDHDLPTVAASDPHLQAPQRQWQAFGRGSDHDLPTVATSDPHLQAPARRQQPPPLPERPPASRSRVVGILSGLIILLLLVGAGIGGLFLYSSHQADLNAIAHSQTATALAQLGQKSTHTPIPPTATPQKGLYIAGTYNGQMFNQTTQQTTTISVFIVQSKGIAPFSGSFTSPQGVSPLKGTVDTQGTFSFTVQLSGGQTPLYFYGMVQQGVYLHGNFCSSSTNSCSTNTGYFTVGPKL